MMTIELVSFRYNLTAPKRIELMIDLVNQSKADLLVFCGHTLKDQNDLCLLKDQIKNVSSFVLFEVKQMEESYFLNLKNCLYYIENGIVHNMFTNQFYSTSGEINANEPLCERFINELETRRRLNVKGHKCLVLQCGEINIIRNLQKEGNRPVFRLQQRYDLEERFNNLMKKTQIILNPIHTPMGNQGKMEKRREYFSDGNRYYFSVSQNGIMERKGINKTIPLDSRRLQYAFFNGKSLDESLIDVTKDFQIRKFSMM